MEVTGHSHWNQLQAAAKGAQLNKQPFILWEGDWSYLDKAAYPFPTLAGHPEGWRHVYTFDSVPGVECLAPNYAYAFVNGKVNVYAKIGTAREEIATLQKKLVSCEYHSEYLDSCMNCKEANRTVAFLAGKDEL